LGLPEDLSGRRVLDIGAWDGAFSFGAERRGAASALATDSFIWSGGDGVRRRASNWRRRVLASGVADREIDVMTSTLPMSGPLTWSCSSAPCISYVTHGPGWRVSRA